MGATDLPGRRCPLPDADGSDESEYAPDQARSPRELLDNLRERLALLPENHPSSARGSADRGYRSGDERAQEQRTQDRAAPAVSGEPVERDIPDPEDADDADTEANDDDEQQLKDPPADWRMASSGGLWSTPLDLGPSGSGEPFQPWFTSGEPGDPWFTDPPLG